MDFHIDYLQSKYSITNSELRCLSKSLGFPDSTLNTLYNPRSQSRIKIKELFEAIKNPEFEGPLDQTFNIYPSKWNNHVILKSILLLGLKVISFHELNLARCVFHFYEEKDGKGLMLNQTKLGYYFKMCGKNIAPMKLEHRLKHMKKRLYNHGRLQLWEFLELLLWSSVPDLIVPPESTIRSVSSATRKNKSEIYNWEKNCKRYYSQESEAQNLNSNYIKEEWTFPKGNFEKILKLLYRPVTCHSTEQRIGEVYRQCNSIKKDLIQSNYNTCIRKCSGFQYQGKETENLQKDSSGGLTEILEEQKCEVKLRNNARIRPKTAPLVTEDDIEISRKNIKDCEMKMKMLPQKYEERIKLDMEYLRPGFWRRWENRPPSHHSCVTHVNLDKRRTPSKHHIDRLSKSSSRLSCEYHKSCLLD